MRYLAIVFPLVPILVIPTYGAEPEIKGTPNELASYLQAMPKVVTVSAEGEAKSQADRAVLSLRIVTEDRQLHDALRANQDIRARIVANLQKHGLETNRIKGAKFSSTPKSGIFTEKARSYRIEHTMQITVADEREFQAVANLVDTTQEIHFAGVEPELPDKEALRNKAISLALANATRKKALYEESLQVILRPRSFSETMVGGLPEWARGNGRWYGGAPPSASLDSKAPAQTGTLPELAAGFGQFAYIAHVSVEYVVESK